MIWIFPYGARCPWMELQAKATMHILIEGLRVDAIIGVLGLGAATPANPWELDLSLEVNDPGLSDELADTVNYAEVVEAIQRLARHERFQLIERFAHGALQCCLDLGAETR